MQEPAIYLLYIYIYSQCDHAFGLLGPKVWWELFLDKAGHYKISSQPGRQENHWPQASAWCDGKALKSFKVLPSAYHGMQVFWPLWQADEDHGSRKHMLIASNCCIFELADGFMASDTLRNKDYSH